MTNLNNSLSFYGRFPIHNNILEDGKKYEFIRKKPINDFYKEVEIIENNKFFFLSGFLYENISEVDIKKNLYTKTLNLIPKHINGSFIGVYYDLLNRELILFTDNFGYNKLYYSKSNDNIFLSSSLWNFNQEIYHSVDSNSIIEHLILGYPLNQKTLFKNIKLVKPGYLELFKGKTYTKKPYYFVEKINLPKNKLIDYFFEISARNFNYISNHNGNEDIGISLTGGGDTRVILNSVLKSSLPIITFTGYDDKNSSTFHDKKRALNIANKLGLKHHNVDFTLFDNNLIQNVMDISGGNQIGHWMASLSTYASNHTNILYFGFDGDIIAGSSEISLKGNEISSIAKSLLALKTYYKSLTIESILSWTTYDIEGFFKEYLSTYNDYRNEDIYEQYFLQEKNERSFRRIASFADGAKLGVTPVNFFHDKHIFDFYRGLPLSLRKNEKLHHQLGAFGNKTLSRIPSANRLEIPHFMMPHIKTLLNNNFAKHIFKKIKGKKSPSYLNDINKDETILDKFYNSLEPFIDLEKIGRSLKPENILLSDQRLLITRLNEVKYILEKIKI